MACLATTNLDGFLLNPITCPAPAPCTCETIGTTWNIHCEKRNLTSIPMLQNASRSRSSNNTVSLWLNENDISTVPKSAFLSLRTYSNSNIVILLNWNRLRDYDGPIDIDIDAFGGIEDKLTILKLRGDKLTSIPIAISRLKYLQHLDLKFNPLLTVDSSVLLSIHQSLLHLEISLRNATSWPSAFQHLTSLEILDITHYSLSLPVSAFNGFNSTLEELSLSAFELQHIPLTVCNLQRLRKLRISFEDSLLSRDMLQCHSPMSSVKELVFYNTKFELFPDIFKPFPNLESLYLMETNTNLIDDSVIPSNSSLSTLHMEQTKLAWLSGAINELPSLKDLSLSGNLIRSVERHSLENLQHLWIVDLSDNPIVFISKQAFWNLPALKFLYLRNSSLTTIPVALQTILPLNDLELHDNEIVCVCELSWLTPWTTNSSLFMYVGGTCNATKEGINTYLTTALQLCP